jgi:cystathionine beta-lyase/cystathionine gamma-synthase
VSELARARGLGLYVDSTFGSPYLQNPLELGATLVLHSATKFLGGHSDVICGFAIGDRPHIQHIHEMRTLMGAVQDPHAAWLVLRGMKTLGVRVQRQSDSALEVARFLEQHEGVQAVHYPWLESSPWHELARRQMRGGGGVVSFEPVGGVTRARSILDALELIPTATSLGGVETIAEIPRDLDFHPQEMGNPQQETAIGPGLIRLSVGLEDPQDLIRDLGQSLGAGRCT